MDNTKERISNDAELVKGGAEVGSDGSIDPTIVQKIAMHTEATDELIHKAGEKIDKVKIRIKSLRAELGEELGEGVDDAELAKEVKRLKSLRTGLGELEEEIYELQQEMKRLDESRKKYNMEITH